MQGVSPKTGVFMSTFSFSWLVFSVDFNVNQLFYRGKGKQNIFHTKFFSEKNKEKNKYSYNWPPSEVSKERRAKRRL